MKKCFVLTQFGIPHPWTQQYIDQVQHLEKDEWYWKIFTPNNFKSKGNVEIIPMNVDQFNDLTEKKLGVRPRLFITESGIPSVHTTDFCIFFGVIFEDYLRNYDFWGMTNWDVVYGDLSKFIPNRGLSTVEVFSDDVNTINGVFSLFLNTHKINHLYKYIGNWRDVINQIPCKKCTTKEGEHFIFGSDELLLTKIVRHFEKDINFSYPKYYPMLSHDRLKQHVPTPQLEIKEDGSLWELFYDTYRVDWEHERPVIGKEIPYFHFSRTKTWPLFQS